MKYLKIILGINLIISLIIFIIGLVNSSIKYPFQDFKALINNNLVLDTLIISSIKYNVPPNNDDSTYEESYEFHLILSDKGKEKKNIYNQNHYDLSNNLINDNGYKKIALLRNKLNNNLFLNDAKYLSKIKRSSFLKIYFYISGILILMYLSKISIFKK